MMFEKLLPLTPPHVMGSLPMLSKHPRVSEALKAPMTKRCWMAMGNVLAGIHFSVSSSKSAQVKADWDIFPCNVCTTVLKKRIFPNGAIPLQFWGLELSSYE